MRVEGVNQMVPVRSMEPVDREMPNRKNNNMNMRQQDVSPKTTEGELISAIEAANKDFEIYDKRLEFSIHEKTKEIIVKIIDSTNDEVIREIPSEKILDMIANMMELAGLLVDEKA